MEQINDGWQSVRLGIVASLRKEQVDPEKLGNVLIDHFSIPAYDEGQVPQRTYASEIQSSKFSILADSVLVSKLNPDTPRVWLPRVTREITALASTEFLVLQPSTSIDRVFLKFLCLSPAFLQEFQSRVTGTSGSHQRVRPQDALSIHIQLPPFPEQQAIGHILGTLDEKIELNRRMNETLEAIARALFKSWFVYFDPVHAKAEGRQIGMDEKMAALFPDGFEESTLGEIPKGWRSGILAEVAENLRRGVLPTEVTPETPYIGLEHMPRKSIALGEWGFAQEVASNKFQFRQGEILFGKLRPYFHKVGVAPQDGVCSTDILVIVPNSPEWYGFVLSHVSSVELVSHTNAASTGTKMPRASWQDIARYQIVLPPRAIAKAFNEIILPMVQMIQANILQTHTLTTIRDTLLPKLLSGEVRVEEAEQLVEAKL